MLTIEAVPQLQQNLTSAQQTQGTALNNLGNFQAGLPAAYAAAPSLYGNAGDQANLVQQTRDAQYNSQTQYLDPQYAQMQKQLQAQLANQGVSYGSDAYNAAMMQFGNQQNQAYGTARDSAVASGNNYANTLFNQNLSANQNYMNNLTTQNNTYANTANALTNTVANPTFAAQPAAANYLGAAQLQNGQNVNQYNAQTGNTNNLTNGLTGLATGLLSNPSVRTGIGNAIGGIGSAIGNIFTSGGG